MELAARIARRSPATPASTKRMLNRSRLLELRTVLSLESSVQPISLLSEEHRAAIQKIFARWEQCLGAREK